MFKSSWLGASPPGPPPNMCCSSPSSSPRPDSGGGAAVTQLAPLVGGARGRLTVDRRSSDAVRLAAPLLGSERAVRAVRKWSRDALPVTGGLLRAEPGTWCELQGRKGSKELRLPITGLVIWGESGMLRGGGGGC